MKLSRIRDASPWHIAAILALIPCLPILTFWAWFKWELPPLQRYYLVAYWDSSNAAKQPGAQTQIRWLMGTAPGRKNRLLFRPEVIEGNQSGLPVELSFSGLEEGWLGIEKTPVQSIDSADVEWLLQRGFYDGRSFRQLVNEPLVYGAATWLLIAYLAFMMREEIVEEWRELRRAVAAPDKVSSSGGDWLADREGIAARIRSRIVHWNRQKDVLLMWATNNRHSRLKQLPNPERRHRDDGPVLTGVRQESSTPQQLANPLPAHSPKPLPQRHMIFPGSSPSDAAHSQSKPWDESEWID